MSTSALKYIYGSLAATALITARHTCTQAFMICPRPATTIASSRSCCDHDERFFRDRWRSRRGHSSRISSANSLPRENPGHGEKAAPDRPQFISILSEDGQEQKLPMASASRFPLWVIEDDPGGQRRAVQVPGESSEDGWVDPRSYDEMWVPMDSPAPTMKLCLGMLTKDGQPRYAMPVVDVVVEKGGKKWRNRGLNTVPSAHCWEPVSRVASGALQISCYAEEMVQGSSTDSIWGTLAENVAVANAFADLVGAIADPPDGMDLGEGFHFLVTEVKGHASFPVPASGGRVRMFLTDIPEPARLLELPDIRGVAELSFDVVSVASGCDSEFLPEVYRGLFAPDDSHA